MGTRSPTEALKVCLTTGRAIGRSMKRYTLLILALLVSAVPGSGQVRGYVERPCGFDLDGDGVVGERFDDCQLCDGVTTDPDGDGVSEDLLYVDADVGSDISGDGSAGKPYGTIAHAWSIADGPGDGAEDIICFRGVSAESYLSPPSGFSGVAGFHSVPASGSEKRTWQYPRDPAMLVGWDFDGDGCYPPYDDGVRDEARCGTTADVAVLDGSSPSAAWAFSLDLDVSYLEMAHFEVRDYGRFSTGDYSGFIGFGRSYFPGHEYLYFHDLEVYRVNMGRFAGSVITFTFFNTNLHWANFSNLLFSDNGGWFARGVPHNGEGGRPDAGPLRWQNITRIMLGPDAGSEYGSTPGFKVWGYTTGVEILDSVWDTNVAAGTWRPTTGGGWANKAFMVRPCSRDWLIRNNEVIDSFIFLTVDGARDTSCENEVARPVDDIVIDRNISRNTWGGWSVYSHGGISVNGGEAGGTEGDWAGEVVGNVTITNNLISSTVSWDSCVEALPGNNVVPPPGKIIIANNTCIGRITRSMAAFTIGTNTNNSPPQPFMQQNFVLKNNIADGLSRGNNNILAAYLPAGLEADFNIFDGLGNYVLRDGGTDYEVPDLTSWRALSGSDLNSRECTPLYADVNAANYRLDPADTCARSSGQNLLTITGVDVDNDARPQNGAWDIGADEVTKETVFRDDFESGDSAYWSVVFP